MIPPFIVSLEYTNLLVFEETPFVPIWVGTSYPFLMGSLPRPLPLPPDSRSVFLVTLVSEVPPYHTTRLPRVTQVPSTSHHPPSLKITHPSLLQYIRCHRYPVSPVRFLHPTLDFPCSLQLFLIDLRLQKYTTRVSTNGSFGLFLFRTRHRWRPEEARTV